VFALLGTIQRNGRKAARADRDVCRTRIRGYTVGSVTARIDPATIDFTRPGAHHYQAAFHLDGSWGYSLVPITVINGTRHGSDTPGVAVFGGTHGNEYEGQIAVKRLCRDLDPREMSGRVILMPQLSERACASHTRDSPEDRVKCELRSPLPARATRTPFNYDS
jgi:predicted deacylase